MGVTFRAVDSEKLEIVVRDTGVGFPEAENHSQMASMGMTLITSLVDQLDGELRVEPGEGTLLRLRFPKKR